ncbi:MAG: hypothetical protein HY452_02485 [Parcubacteria group bacterium]|nr:hypothetical protein [Parcubacteria group bacterium]
MKYLLIKIFIVSIIITLVGSVSFSSAQEYLEQASQADLDQIESAINAITETAFRQSVVETGNDFNLDIIWKANTILPYDYSGKALPSPLSFITLYALADAPNPERLIYTWLVDDISSNKDGPELQGRGKSVFSVTAFQTPEFTHEIRVFVQDDQGRRGSATLEIKTVSPETYFYIFHNDNYNNLSPDVLRFSPNRESSLMVRPFYFNTSNPANLEYDWRFDGRKEANSSPRPEILPINIGSNLVPGMSANLRLELKNKKAGQNIYDRATRTTEIKIIK